MVTDASGAWRAAVPRLDTSPLVFTASRRKTVRVALIGVAFTLLGAWMASQPGDLDGLSVAAAGWASVVLGLLGVAAAALNLLRPPTLTVSASGFALTTAVKTYETPWDAIERFFPWSPPRARKRFVGYRKRGSVTSGLQNVSRTLGADGAVPDQFDIPMTELLDLLEASRIHWSRGGDAAA